MSHTFPPQRSTSMGPGEDLEKSSSPAAESSPLDSPYAARMPVRPPAVIYNSQGIVRKEDHLKGMDAKGALMTTPELIRPSPGNPARQSEPQTAMFNLIATIVGGGVLSMPYAIMKMGVVTGLFVMALGAVAGDFSLYMLCSCSRRTGKITYVKVGEAAFGAAGGVITTTVLLILTVFVMIGYMVLVRDIWAGNVSVLIGEDLDKIRSNQVLFGALLLVFPVCLATDLRALRHFCYVGFFSVLVLTIAMGYLTVKAGKENPFASNQLKLCADSWGDIMEALPILSLAFMAHFNILSVHSQFVNPTRERLKGLLHGTMGLAAALYVTLGLCGYLYSYDGTQDDILLNFDPRDRVMLLGRLGMGINVLVAVIMLVIPCRDILVEAGVAMSVSLQGFSGSKNYIPITDVERTTRGTPVADAVAGALGSCLKIVRHVGITIALMGFSLYVALVVPGVSIVWSICGSSVGFTITYLLPSVFYLKIRWHKPFSPRKAGALLMLVTSFVMIVMCTKHSIHEILG